MFYYFNINVNAHRNIKNHILNFKKSKKLKQISEMRIKFSFPEIKTSREFIVGDHRSYSLTLTPLS